MEIQGAAKAERCAIKDRNNTPGQDRTAEDCARQKAGLDAMLESSTALGLYDAELDGIPTPNSAPEQA